MITTIRIKVLREKMSHFESIGFKINSAEEFEALVAKIFENGEAVETEDGTYTVYTDDSGAQIYAQVDANGEFIGFMPFYDAKSERKVHIQGTITYDDATVLDIRYQSMSEEETYPFVFDAVNAKTRVLEAGTESLPFVAFPQEITYFETAGAFMKEFPELSTTYLIPIGLMTPEGEANPNPEPYVMFVGEIKSVELKTNDYSKGEFYVLEVSALDGEVSIVTSKDSLGTEPKVGAFVNGVFWMGAKV